ncbi:MAG TPA: hypothetical protein VER11_26290 [Polyangiaceae bacterium]|nr:hypothetical protein [Polyangiaceae bacterium]
MTEAEEVPNLPEPTAPEPTGPSVSTGAVLNAEGRERPRFLLEFPDDPALQQLVREFEAGNYRAVREGAVKLAEATEDPIVRAAARELARRIEPDPLMKYLLFVALGLFVFIVWSTYQGQH